MSSILELAIEVADEVSLGRPSSLVGAGVTDDDAFKIIRHMNKTCRMLATRYDWTFLQAEQTFTTVAAEAQTNAIPSDFRRFINQTFWNRTDRRPVHGPLSPRDYAYMKANVSDGIRDQYRKRGSEILVYPAPAAGETFAFEYITNYIGTDTLGTTYKAAFTDDTDIPLFDDELVILGTIWRYKKAEGQDYSEEFNEYEQRFADLIAQDGGKKNICMGGERYGRIIKPIFEDYAS